MSESLKIPCESEYQEWKRPKRIRWLELRKQVITSTEISAVAGISKYGNTRFSIYHTKRGDLEDSFVPNVRSNIGLDIEHAIAKMVMRETECKVHRYPDFARRERLGASFDYEFPLVAAKDGLPHEYDRWLVEIKNVDYMIFRDQWEKDSQGRHTPPEHIILQTQAQLEVSRRPGCLLAVLVGGNDLNLIPIARDAEFGAALRKIANDFWRDIEEGNEPDVIAEDSKNAAALYNYADPDSTWDATEDDVLSHKIASYKNLKEKAKSIEADANAIKAEVLVEIKDASKIFCMDGYTLDAGVTKASLGKEVTEEMVGNRIGARGEFRRFTVRKAKVAS